MPLVISATAGVLLSFALPPGGWWPLSFALFPLFALVARAAGGRAALARGFWFGLPFFSLYILWLPRSFSQLFGNAFWLVFPPLVLLLALFWGLTTWGAWLLAGGRSGRAAGPRVLLVLPALWVLVEWARTQGYFAFPWGTVGYAWLDTPPAQLAEYGGVYGLSLLSAVGAALLAWPLSFGPRASVSQRAGVGLVALALVLALTAGAFSVGGRLGEGVGRDDAILTPRYALLVQGNVDPFARAATAAQELEVHLALTREGMQAALLEGKAPELVVWPEGAVTGYHLSAGDSGALISEITATAEGATFIVGGRAYERGVFDSYNSLFSLQGGSVLGRYDKEYLVPFGERWPLIDTLGPLYEGVFGLFGLPMLAGTLPGNGPHTLQANGGSVAAFICYESVFPQVQRAMVGAGAELLVLATNDAWFGVGNGARQHFDMGRMRAIETRRYLLRAGNDGITAAVDAHGRVITELPRHVAGTLLVPYELLDGGTFYVKYGQWFPLTLLVWILLLAAGAVRAGGARPAKAFRMSRS